MIKRIMLVLMLVSISLYANNFRQGMRAYIKGDFVKAKVLFELSMTKDKTIHGGYMLGRMYLRGKGVDKNIKKSIILLEHAYLSGNIPAGCYLAEAYMLINSSDLALGEGIIEGLITRVPRCKQTLILYKDYVFPKLKDID